MFKSADEAIKFIKDNAVEFVDVRFMDLIGVMQHFNIPAQAFNNSVFEVSSECDLQKYVNNFVFNLQQENKLRFNFEKKIQKSNDA